MKLKIKKTNSGEIQTKPCLFLDTETFGLVRNLHPLCEVAMVDMDANTLANVKLLPSPLYQKLAEPQALEINGFDLEKWKLEALPKEKEIAFWMEMQKQWKDAVIVGSNPLFDMERIAKVLWEKLGETPTWYYKPIDISALFLQKFGYFCGMATMAKELGVATTPDHSALNDALASREVFLALMGDSFSF